ncbi:SprT family zinc-dependent metalloprotease [Shewanella abyssi]|uniref:SprT family zinc-dependent metalloprotease n=1 Tax=Shewanella abyssi TaxID=311789 RepID=UPI00200BB6EE|nr:SprT family zinc-dependent metalloprotease [Shewanella abyssi]MCL1050274.1 SprT family zinc-dependent metalloprotease [Shewanella abyssi]
MLAAKAIDHPPVTFADPLQQSIASQVEHCYQLAETHLGQKFPRPEINFKLRGKSAGTAHLQLNKLRFNPLLLKDNQQAFIDDVVPHEICHLLSFQLYGRVKPHGVHWQRLMRQLYHRQPRTTHSFNTQSVEGKTYEYLCGCGSVNLSIRRHNKVLRGETQYRCRKCGHNLRSSTEK